MNGVERVEGGGRRLAVAAAAAAVALLSILAVPSPRPARASDLPRVSFVAGPGGSVLVHGTYPHHASPCKHPSQPLLHERFQGTVEVGRASDGTLFVIDQLPFEDYVKGIGEVPRTWPMAALEAQAIAARSYALAQMSYPDATGRALGYQLCATDACQVYLGMSVSAGPYGNRWRSAVNATDGQALVYGGRPADTLYFSTSNGHTYGNDKVFGSAPLPYLRPIVEPDDGASPLSHWKATIPLPDLTLFLHKAGVWGSGSIGHVRTSGSNVILAAAGSSRTRTLTTTDFRNDLDYWAPCLDPDHYPGTNGDNGIHMPQSVPSHWFSISTKGQDAVIDGRGWGHGVGLVQWGAYGKALRGLSDADILAAYYGGLRPAHVDEPAVIRIGAAVGLSSVNVAATGAVTAEGTTLPAGPWSITGGSRLHVRPGTPLPTYIGAGTLTTPKRAAAGHRLTAELSLPQLSVVHLVLQANGEERSIASPKTYQAGNVTLNDRVAADTVTGIYTVLAEVTNGTDIVRTAENQIRIAGVQPTPPPPSAAPTRIRPIEALPPPGKPSPWPLFAVAAVAAVVAVFAALLLTARVRRRKSPSSEATNP